jgi:hypothetical protein
VLFKSRSLGDPIPQSPCREFSFFQDPYGDHIQTCQCQSVVLSAYERNLLFRLVGHRVETGPTKLPLLQEMNVVTSR